MKLVPNHLSLVFPIIVDYDKSKIVISDNKKVRWVKVIKEIKMGSVVNCVGPFGNW